MDNLPNFVTSIVRLWNVNQNREDLYKQAMTLDNLGTLRRVCSHGYISSLLFKKEIQWLYDSVKCTLSDGNITEVLKSAVNDVAPFSFSEDKLSIARIIHQQEELAIKLYKSILSGLKLSSDENQILTDHLEKLKDIDENLNKELMNSYENYQPFKQSFA